MAHYPSPSFSRIATVRGRGGELLSFWQTQRAEIWGEDRRRIEEGKEKECEGLVNR